MRFAIDVLEPTVRPRIYSVEQKIILYLTKLKYSCSMRALLVGLVFICLPFVVSAQYSAVGNSVSTLANGENWSNTSDAINDDGNRATVSLSGSEESDFLVVTNFGFAIPETETINGIEVTINKSHSNLFSYVTDLEVRLVQNGSLVGNNRANFGGYPVFDINYTYGSSIDTWGLDLEPEDVNDPGFGVAIASQRIFGLGGSTARIDNVSMSVSTTTPLPVELVAFELELKQDKVNLLWTTASEINNDYFEIQKSQDGFVFQTIAHVNGNGNTTQSFDYAFKDQLEQSGNYYYRLKQVDFDGTYAYSEVEFVSYKNIKPAQVYPNPAVNVLSFKNIESETFQVNVSSMEAVVVLQKQLSNGMPLDVSALPRGWFLIQIIDGTEITHHRVLIR